MLKKRVFLMTPLILFISLKSMALSVVPPTDPPEKILRDLLQKSTVVISGTVTRLQSRRGGKVSYLPTDLPLILTDVTINVTQSFKGRSNPSETFIIPGGCLKEEDICFENDLFPKFKVGEEVLLFLTEEPAGNLKLTDPILSKQPIATPFALPVSAVRKILRDGG